MGKKLTAWKTKGMNRDISVSAFNPEFAFENVNLRLSTNDGNTALSWVNEKGPKSISIITGSYSEDETANVTSLKGTPIGVAVLNHQFVVFTTEMGKINPDHIYKLKYENIDSQTMLCVELYNGDLNFDTDYPLETMVYYEAEYIQKVYWVDGKNQPRIININASSKQREHWKRNNTSFDFAPAAGLKEVFSVKKQQSGGGLFAPGVIQYCFTYVNKYGQQTNIINVSPLEYLCHSERGASPEEKVTSNFKITITGCDTTFDFVRLYSIQRTSLDLDPIVKILEDIDIPEGENATIEYTDNGTTGAIIDPYELLYVGGKEIIANTMEDKDNTLFLGNLTQKNTNVNSIQDYFLENKVEVKFGNDDDVKSYNVEQASGIYTHTNALKESSKVISTFKGGEQYRFGFQLQKTTGEWSEPIYLDDADNNIYPSIRVNALTNDTTVTLPYAYINNLTLPSDLVDTTVYKRIRPLVVYPNIGDRKVLCQGVLNPTVFNALDRIDNSPYAQASWFFRPNCNTKEDSPYKEIDAKTLDQDAKYKAEWSRTLENDMPEDAFYKSYADVTSHQYDKEYFKHNVIPVYVFICILEGDEAREVLRRKYVSARRMVNGNHKWEKVDFWGGIILQDYSSADYAQFEVDLFRGKIGVTDNVVLALVKKTPWEKEIEGDSNYFHYDDNYTYERVVNETFYMYKRMQVTSTGLLYYIKPGGYDENTLQEFWFNFKDDSDEAKENHGHIYHHVTFYSTIKNTEGMSEEFTTLDVSNGGNTLRFKHYDSLYTESDLVWKKKRTGTEALLGDISCDIIDQARQIEIQGSVNNYDTPFSEAKGINSNTQFFIDQSIVTLNSPDIEFDTEVQTFGTENLQLKIVGAIPIDANVSYHNINISSAMLDEMHNWGANQYEIRFGVGEKNHSVTHNYGTRGVGNRLISDYLWNDIVAKNNSDYDDSIETLDFTCNYLIYPWHRKGSLSNDPRTADVASSMLSTKKESTLLYSFNTKFINTGWNKDIAAQIVLTENSQVINTRIDAQGGINYYANVDKILYNESGYSPITDNTLLNNPEEESTTITSGGTKYNSSDIIKKVFSPIPMQYKSTSHAVVAMDNDILPSSGDINVCDINKRRGTTFWKKHLDFSQDNINGVDSDCFLWLGELVKEPTNPFGGTSKEAIEANKWMIGGEAVDINENGIVNLKWTEGDTYYQRYDCLKTYAYTPEDVNQIVEILSFMCETHVNIDGRYDRNRGQVDNTNMRPEIFNKLNTAYSQKNNFFLSQKTGLDDRDKLHYPNYITYTKTKTSGADVDLYTNVTLASTMELDGDKGEITSLNRYNNQLIAFQDTGISQLLYNENTMLSTDKGVPVELANSGKVTGKNYLSNTLGCSNKWSICQTPSGVYFIDSNEKSIYLFNGQFQNLSLTKGFNAWSKQNFPSDCKPWDPVNFGARGTGKKVDYFVEEFAEEFHPIEGEEILPEDVQSNFVTYYDRQNQDVLFISRDTCLAYSEKLGVFTSFYSYENTPFFSNLDTTGVWLTRNCGLFQHQTGDYGNFFGSVKPYWMTVIGNPEPQTDKTFTNLEFRATVTGEGKKEKGKYDPFLPFDTLETWDEYQHGIANLQNKHGHPANLHHLRDEGLTAALKRKFRIWRCDIPRDNAEIDDETESLLGIKRFSKHPNDRMRNPWLYLKLTKNAEEEKLPKAEIHDLLMTYFN